MLPKRLTLVESACTNPYRNLALEEWLLGQVACDEVILYLWQNQHTVVIGKNQNAWKECNITTLEADGGHLARRLSGGGAVYHDLGNLNFTFLAHKAHYDIARQLEVILQALRRLGIQAEKSGRNDVLVDGRKVSGNAFYEHGDRAYHHGTLLMQVDGEKMARYLNVSQEKLASKGVASVKARVRNLVDVCPDLTVAALKQALIDAFADVYGGTPNRMPLEAVDQAAWQALTERYSDWRWIFGRKFRFDRSVGKRFEWGRVDVALQIDSGTIVDAQVYSDALLPDLMDALALALRGVRYNNGALKEAVQQLSAETAAAQTAKNDVMDWLATIDC